MIPVSEQVALYAMLTWPLWLMILMWIMVKATEIEQEWSR
jgi:hypothetical protein